MDLRPLVCPLRYRHGSSLFGRRYLRAPGTCLAPDKWFALFAPGLKLVPTESSRPNASVSLGVQSGFGAGRVTSFCGPRPSSLIVWTVDELKECKIFSLHFVNQVFCDWWYYYRISQQRNFSVGATVKMRNSKRKSIFSWAPGTDETWRLSEVTQREDALEGVQIEILHGNASTEQMMGEIFSLMVKPLVHKGFLKIIGGLFLF